MAPNLTRINNNMMKQAMDLSKKSKQMNNAFGVIPPSMEALASALSHSAEISSKVSRSQSIENQQSRTSGKSSIGNKLKNQIRDK